MIWAVDLADGHVALLATILLDHGQKVRYISGSALNRAVDGYRGRGKRVHLHVDGLVRLMYLGGVKLPGLGR